MRALAILAALLPALALGQAARPGTSSSAGGTAAGGISTVAALGTCAAPSAGKVVWLSPSSALYACDGTAWRLVHTDREEGLLNADSIGALRTLALLGPAAGYALLVQSGKVDFGPGVNDECLSDSTYVNCNSWRFGDVSTDVLANKTTNANLVLSLARYLQAIPTSVTACAAGDAGGLMARSTDGNRPYWCDGTAAYRVSRVVTQSVNTDFPSINNNACSTTSLTVVGAQVGDFISVQAAFALPDGVVLAGGNTYASATNTVTLTLCNITTAGPLDPPFGQYIFRLER